MLFEEFRTKYLLSDGQVLGMSVDFEQKQISLRLNARVLNGKKAERCEIKLHLNESFELDLVDTLDMEWHSDMVFIRLENGEFYLSFDPFGNSGLPNDSDNFVIKCKGVELFHDGEQYEIE